MVRTRLEDRSRGCRAGGVRVLVDFSVEQFLVCALEFCYRCIACVYAYGPSVSYLYPPYPMTRDRPSGRSLTFPSCPVFPPSPLLAVFRQSETLLRHNSHFYSVFLHHSSSIYMFIVVWDTLRTNHNTRKGEKTQALHPGYSTI